jgi:hypothetical protein
MFSCQHDVAVNGTSTHSRYRQLLKSISGGHCLLLTFLEIFFITVDVKGVVLTTEL